MAASSFGFFPFTNAQWKELETQAMIYKYMRASLPVPPELLLPITRNLSGHAASHSTFGRGSVYNLRFSNKLDPEPGRCKRTDGKKWRCAKDVAPDQKYCERHVNRGRARSRKHVETHSDFKNNKKPRLQNVLATTPNTVMGNLDDSATRYLGSAAQQYHLNSGALFPGQRSESKGPIFESMVSVPTPHKEPRSLEWMMEQKGVPFTTSNQKWHQLMEIKTELQPVDCRSICSTDACVYQHHYDKHEPLDLNSYVHFGAGKDQFLNLNPNDVPQTENPRGFIDAWSNIAEDSVSSKGNLSMSALNLSIASDNTIGDKIGQIEMGLGIINSDENNKSQVSNWLNPSSSWIGTITLGGPLAEVLRSNTSVSSVAGSPITGNGDQASPREAATVSSSPSGVLQKTFASVSDSSGNSSPTFVASRLESKIGFQWMKQSNY